MVMVASYDDDGGFMLSAFRYYAFDSSYGIHARIVIGSRLVRELSRTMIW